MSIGENIKKLRLERGITQDVLGERIGVTGKAVSAWELGSKTPRMGALQRLADFFGISKSELIEESRRPAAVHIPVLGRVAAGAGCIADDNIEGYEIAPADMLSSGEQYIFLNVKGDSMSPKIEEGDRLLVQLQSSVDSGSYAIVLIDNEDGVVKKVRYTSDRIELISENPYYPPRIFEGGEVSRVSVVGLVKYVFRAL